MCANSNSLRRNTRFSTAVHSTTHTPEEGGVIVLIWNEKGEGGVHTYSDRRKTTIVPRETVTVNVYARTYSHRHGSDVAVYTSEEARTASLAATALQYRDERADQEAPKDPRAEGWSDDQIIKAYFENHPSEYYIFSDDILVLDISVLEQLLANPAVPPGLIPTGLTSDETLYIRSLGKDIPVTGIFRTETQANAYLTSHPDESVIAAHSDRIYTATHTRGAGRQRRR